MEPKGTISADGDLTSQDVIDTLLAAGWKWQRMEPGLEPMLVNKIEELPGTTLKRRTKAICKRGHIRTGVNVRYGRNRQTGARQNHCRVCDRLRWHERKKKRKSLTVKPTL